MGLWLLVCLYCYKYLEKSGISIFLITDLTPLTTPTANTLVAAADLTEALPSNQNKKLTLSNLTQGLSAATTGAAGTVLPHCHPGPRSYPAWVQSSCQRGPSFRYRPCWPWRLWRHGALEDRQWPRAI